MVEFVDNECYLQYIDLRKPENRVADVNIKPDIDVPGFSMVLAGFNSLGQYDISNQ